MFKRLYSHLIRIVERQWIRLQRKGGLMIATVSMPQTVLAGLPDVEGPQSSTDGSFYGQIAGYINDGIVLGGLVLAAVAMLGVGNAVLATYAEVRDGKATWAKFGMLCVVGVILIVIVIWLAAKAATVMLG